MINTAFALSIEEKTKLMKLRKTPLYKEYTKAVMNSPLYVAMAQEYLDNVDVTNDLKALSAQPKIAASELNIIFRNTLRDVTIGIMADTIILKELAEVSIDDVVSDIKENFKIKYLLGLADDSFYEEAEKLVKKNGITDTVLSIGLTEHYKRKGTYKNDQLMETKKEKAHTTANEHIEKKTRSINIDGDHVVV